jgi:hypothetical protein
MPAWNATKMHAISQLALPHGVLVRAKIGQFVCNKMRLVVPALGRASLANKNRANCPDAQQNDVPHLQTLVRNVVNRKFRRTGNGLRPLLTKRFTIVMVVIPVPANRRIAVH